MGKLIRKAYLSCLPHAYSLQPVGSACVASSNWSGDLERRRPSERSWVDLHWIAGLLPSQRGSVQLESHSESGIQDI